MIRFLSLLLVGCGYISDPPIDPTDPTTFSIYNAGPDTAYLRLSDDGSVLGAALAVSGLRIALQCADSFCSDSAVTPCVSTPSVRALGAGESLLVQWYNVKYEGDACVQSAQVSKGRYDLVVCSSSQISAGGRRSTEDTHVIVGATTVSETCRAPLSFSVPNPEVHWAINLP